MLFSLHSPVELADVKQVKKAIQFLATIAQREGGQSSTLRSSARKGSLVGSFFEQFSLGIMALFSESINDTQIRQPITEKRRSVKGIEEMVQIAGMHISHAIPQVRIASAFGSGNFTDSSR
jgi:hypothetical protein